MLTNFEKLYKQKSEIETHFLPGDAGRSKEEGKMRNLFSLIVRFEVIEDGRPKVGWSIYTQTPSGLKPLTTKRGRPRRFATLDKVFSWAAKEYAGYGLQIEGPYEGLLIGTSE